MWMIGRIGMMMVWIISWPIMIPITTPIAYAPSYGIPSAIVIGTIPRVVIPWIPMPWVVDVGNTIPIPWVVIMSTMESCQPQSIVIVNIFGIRVAMLVAFSIT